MTLVLLIAFGGVIGVVRLWRRTNELVERQRRAEIEAVRLANGLELIHGDLVLAEEHLHDLQARFDAIQGAVAAPSAAAKEAAAATGVAEAAAARPEPAAPYPLVDGQAGEPEPRKRGEWVISGDVPPRKNGAPLTGAVSGARPGPGMVQRLLDQLGLAPASAGERRSQAALEAWLEGRMLAVVGGVALLLGAVFFLSLAFSRGWITEPMRVFIGLVVGAGLLVLGELGFSKLHGIVGHVLVAVGLAIVSLALFAATRLYDLGVPVELGLSGALVAAIAAAAIAIRHDSQLVAAFGLIAVLAAPPVLGASPTMVTLLFVAAALVGTTGIALFRTWIWLPPLSFVLAGPQLASYVAGGPPLADGLIAIAGFWLVNALAAGGEETHHATDRLRSATVTLLLASAAFTLWAGFTVLSGPEAPWRGTFLVVMAVAHAALGLLFLVRLSDRHPFGLVVAATGVAALTMAIPVQFGGPPVPIAWAAEGVALAWIAVQRRHPYSAGVAVLLGVLALGHLLLIEYSPRDLVSGFDRVIPFIAPEGMTFAFVVAALAATSVIVRIAWVRTWLAVAGGLAAIYVFPFELSGPALVAGWAAIAAAGLIVHVRVVMPRLAAAGPEDRVAPLGLPGPIVAPVAAIVSSLSRRARAAFLAPAAIAGIAVLAHLIVVDFPIDQLGRRILSAVPYAGPESLSLLAAFTALGLVGWGLRARWIRLGSAGIGGSLLAYTVTFEVGLPHLMVVWGLIAVASLAVVRRVAIVEAGPPKGRPSVLVAVEMATERLPYAAAGLALVFLVVQALWYADPGSFVGHLAGQLPLKGTPFLDLVTYGLVVLAVTILAAGWIWRGVMPGLRSGVAAGLVLAWLLAFEVRPGYAVAGWSALAFAALAVLRRLPGARQLLGSAAIAVASFGALVAVVYVAPLDRLVVDATTAVPGWPFLTDATVALGALAIAAGAGALVYPRERLRPPALAAAGLAAVYLLSVGVVDQFQLQVAARPLDELQKGAQVGLSILWSVLGAIGFAIGLGTHRSPIRVFGFGLLGLATVKVFLVDLAALDVAYRVLSLVALGILLLLSAAVYSRVQHPHGPVAPGRR